MLELLLHLLGSDAAEHPTMRRTTPHPTPATKPIIQPRNVKGAEFERLKKNVTIGCNSFVVVDFVCFIFSLSY